MMSTDSGIPYECVLFDMDGVLASVGSSYRESIIRTAAHFGVIIEQEDINIEKKKGNSNNDWILTKRLIDAKRSNGEEVTLEEVTKVFEDIYQGIDGTPGLCTTEQLIPSRGFLEEIYRRCRGKVAVVTGRPRKDCMKFLETHNLQQYVSYCVCMEDGPPKPDPSPVILAYKYLQMDPKVCVMIGDTPDDIRAAVSAGVRGWGVLTPEEDAKITLGMLEPTKSMTISLMQVGAEGVMRCGMSQLLDLIPSHSPIILSPTREMKRVGIVSRETKETSISASVYLDGEGKSDISTGIGFLDHMFSQLSKHGRFDISMKCSGDLHIDDHHTAEDCALALGEAFDKALGKREKIVRFGYAMCPLDESLSRAVVDISSRPHAEINLQLTREMIGTISSEMLKHVLESFAMASRITLHVHNIHGENNHHKVESAFKALGVAMRQAVSMDNSAGVPSTKGVLA